MKALGLTRVQRRTPFQVLKIKRGKNTRKAKVQNKRTSLQVETIFQAHNEPFTNEIFLSSVILFSMLCAEALTHIASLISLQNGTS